MWNVLKYLYLAIRLATLWENLKNVRAKDPQTSGVSYQPAAAALLADEGIQRWLSRLSPDDQARFTEGLPVFIWGLDNLTE